MQYRRFGKTELHLSVFSLGTMRCLTSESEFYQTIQAGVNQGINHLETARGYGNSEKYLGKALQAGLALPRHKLYITTKLPPTPDPGAMDRWIDESLERLQLDYIDCLGIHGVNTHEHLQWITKPKGCMQAVHQGIADGRLHHVGFSTHGSLELILATINTDLFDFVNLHYYYFFQRHREAIALAHQKDMGIFIISPGDKGGQLHTPSSTLQKLCGSISPLHLNYRFLLSDRRITTLSLGAANPQELEIPLQVANQDQDLTSVEQEIFQSLETQLEERLGTENCRQCYQCLPCPEAIHIPEILRLRNLTIAYDMEKFGKYRYQMFGNAGHWFPGVKGNACTSCGDCLPRCPEKLNIPLLLQDTHQRLKGKARRRLWQE